MSVVLLLRGPGLHDESGRPGCVRVGSVPFSGLVQRVLLVLCSPPILWNVSGVLGDVLLLLRSE